MTAVVSVHGVINAVYIAVRAHLARRTIKSDVDIKATIRRHYTIHDESRYRFYRTLQSQQINCCMCNAY